jgi:hypothetical protein
LTQIRKDKELQSKVQFDSPLTEPSCFELRHIDDDSDSDGGDVYYKPFWDLPPLGDNQQIGEFEALVLV